MKNLNIIFFYSLTTCWLLGQSQTECIIITDSGQKINGYVKRFNPNHYPIGATFKYFDLKNKKHKIGARFYNKLLIGATTYKSIITRKGEYHFMKLIESGPKASLYEDSESMTMNIPGEGLSSWSNDEYYIIRNDKSYYISFDVLYQEPEAYFPNAIELCKEIKNYKGSTFMLDQWIKKYNPLD